MIQQRGLTIVRQAAVVCLAMACAVFAARAEDGLTTPAPYAIVTDYETGMVLFEKNADDLMAPASMSKLMTVEMAFNRIKNGSMSLEDEILISEEAWRRGGAVTEGSTMFAKVNSRIPLADILRGIIVQSGNDACIALAEAIGGTEDEFARMMTARARELGMEESIFANATGWPHPDHRMTARDLSILARHIIATYPDLYEIYSETAFTWNGIRQSNRNPLLHVFDGADGLKTGHTEASGYGLVGSAERDGRRFIMVVNGLESDRQRAMESRRLMTLAFNSFRRDKFIGTGDTVGEAEVFKGKAESVPLIVAEDLNAFVLDRLRRQITVELTYTEPLVAPIAKGQEVGTLALKVPGQRDLVTPVYTAEAVDQIGLMGQLGISFGRFVMGTEAPEPAPKTESMPLSR